MRDESCLQLSKQVEEVFRLIQGLKLLSICLIISGILSFAPGLLFGAWIEVARGPFPPSAFPCDILARFSLFKARDSIVLAIRCSF
jgi:hypothetical protein